MPRRPSMRAPVPRLLAAAVFGAALSLMFGCESGPGAGVCVTTHLGVADQRYRSPAIGDCEEYCDSVEGYVCCYYQPDEGSWVAVAGDC